MAREGRSRGQTRRVSPRAVYTRIDRVQLGGARPEGGVLTRLSTPQLQVFDWKRRAELAADPTVGQLAEGKVRAQYRRETCLLLAVLLGLQAN